MWAWVIVVAAGLTAGQVPTSTLEAQGSRAASPARQARQPDAQLAEALVEGLGAVAALQLAVDAGEWERARRLLATARILITGGHEEHWRGRLVGGPPQASGLAAILGARGSKRAQAALQEAEAHLNAIARAIATRDGSRARAEAADLVRAFTIVLHDRSVESGEARGEVVSGAFIARGHLVQAYDGAVALVASLMRGEAASVDVRFREIGWHLDQAEAASPTPESRAALAPIRARWREVAAARPPSAVAYDRAVDLVAALSEFLR